MLPNPLLLEYTDSSLLEELIDFSCHSDINSMVGEEGNILRWKRCDPPLSSNSSSLILCGSSAEDRYLEIKDQVHER